MWKEKGAKGDIVNNTSRYFQKELHRNSMMANLPFTTTKALGSPLLICVWNLISFCKEKDLAMQIDLGYKTSNKYAIRI